MSYWWTNAVMVTAIGNETNSWLEWLNRVALHSVQGRLFQFHIVRAKRKINVWVYLVWVWVHVPGESNWWYWYEYFCFWDSYYTPYYRLESSVFKPDGYDKNPSGSKATCKVRDVTRNVGDTWRYTQLTLKRTFRVFFFIICVCITCVWLGWAGCDFVCLFVFFFACCCCLFIYLFSI